MAPGSSRPGFRGDIDGLRAVAILLVVAYHGLLRGFGGGFIGVDVFFVISGYLITTNLLRDYHVGTSIKLRVFWARRMRRLVPALTLLNLCVLVAVVVVVSPLDWSGVVKELLAATLYVSNLFYARQAQNYFNSDLSNSVLLHTWSLSVEEQFYVVWPLLILGAGWLARRRTRLSRAQVLVAVLGVVTVVSFGVSVLKTARGEPTAFYGLESRAWEFGLAGLLACAAPLLRARRSAPFAAAAGWAGSGLLVVSMTVIGHGTSFPGIAALLPVGATLLLIVAGTAGWSPVSRLLALPPLQAVGRVSYSWYLWHWPAIVLATIVLSDSAAVRTTAALLSAIPAVIAYRYVEQPFRRSPRWARSRATYVAVACVTVVMLGACIGVYQIGRSVVAGDPLLAKLQSARASEFSDLPCGKPNPPIGTPAPGVCQFGEPDAPRTLFLIGDSHAEHWSSAFAAAAARLDARVLVRWTHDCPFTDTRITKAFDHSVPAERCRSEVETTRRIVLSARPDLVVISNWAGYLGRIADAHDRVPRSDAEQATLWRQGMTSALASLRASDLAVVVVVDSPTFGSDPVRCLARSRSVRPCTYTRPAAMSRGAEIRDASRVAGQDLSVPLIDAADLTCLRSTCPPIIDGQVVYRDTNHITVAFGESRAGQVAERISAALHTS